MTDEPKTDSAEAQTSRKRWLLGAAIAALVIALLVGGAWLTSRDDAKGASGSASNSAASDGGSGSGSSASGDASGSPSNRLTPAEKAAAKRAAKRGSADSTRTTGLALDGSRLATVSTPPSSTIVMLAPGAVPADARLAVTFRPYGRASIGGDGVVIHIDTARALNDSAKKFASLAGRNVFASVDTTGSGVGLGGRYEGELRFVSRSNGVSFVIFAPEPIE